MIPCATRMLVGLIAVLGVSLAHADYSICPNIVNLKTTKVFADAGCTKVIEPGSTWLQPSSIFEVWIGGGSWIKVDVSCDGLGGDTAEWKGADKAEHFLFGLDDQTHQCTATFDKYSFTNPPYKQIAWSVKGVKTSPPPPQQSLVCAQRDDDSVSPLTFTCTLLNGITPVANIPIYYKLRTSSMGGTAINAFNLLLNNTYHDNDSAVRTGGQDAAGTLITGSTDSRGVSKIRTFVDFAKMTVSYQASWFPTQDRPMTITVYASTAPDFSAPSAQFDLKLDSVGSIEQVWVAEAPGCLKAIDCTQAVSLMPDAAQRRVHLETYRTRTNDLASRVKVIRKDSLSGDPLEREISFEERVQVGDIFHFDANGIIPTICPSCYTAMRGDGSPEPGFVYAKFAFWDGVKGLIAVNSSYPGTYDLTIGKVVSDKFGRSSDRFERWGWAKIWDKVKEAPVEWYIVRSIPGAAGVLNAKEGIEWTVEGLQANEWGRAIFVNANSAIHARSVPNGVSTLTTIEGNGVLYSDGSDTSIGTVTGGATAEMRLGQVTPTIRATTAAEAKAARDGLGLLNSSCAVESILHSNINQGACNVGNTATFNLAQASDVSRLAVWYNTAIGGSRLPYTLQGPDRMITGFFVPSGCDLNQGQWCLGEASLNQTLGPGAYTITAAASAVCRNATSSDIGFSVVRGCVTAAALAPAVNYQGLWWNPVESGWGINFAHQGDTIFATWFIYDDAGRPWWLIAELHLSQDGTSYAGNVSQVAGEPFNTVPWDPARIGGVVLGMMTVVFTSPSSAKLTYTVTGATQEKSIVKQEFGTVPTCTWGGQTDPSAATNYTDLWWNARESGWGVNFSHQSDIVFATWFTYDSAGKPWWLIIVADRVGSKVYSGTIYTVTGPPFSAVPFDTKLVHDTPVGNATITFTDGNHARFDYTVNGVTQSKNLVRQVFAPPGTVCR